MAYSYDKKKDYTKLMQDAANSGNWEQAAIYEQQRNAKIAGEGLNQYKTSQTYARYLPTTYGYNAKTDYQKLMDQAAAGGDMARAAIYEQQRNQKIREGNGGTHTMSYNYTDYLPGMSQQVGKTGYKNPYLDQLNASIEKLGDESALKQQYLIGAQKGVEDTLGAYAANTGGIASTGAVAAAQQAGDNYRSQMGTALQNQRQQYTNALMNASGLAQSDYQINIQEAMNRWTQLGYADDFVASVLGVAPGTGTASQNYQLWSQQFQKDQAAQQQANTEWNQQYQQQQAERDWKAQQWSQQYQQQQADRSWESQQWSQNYQQQQADRNQAYTMAMNILQTGGKPTPELLAAAGIDQSAADQLSGYYSQQQAYQQCMQLLSAGVMPNANLLAAAGLTSQQAQQIAAAKTSSGSSGGGSSSGSRRSGSSSSSSSKNSGKAPTAAQYTKLLNAYAEGDGSWVNVAKGLEQEGRDLSGFYAEVGLDPNDPYTEKKTNGGNQQGNWSQQASGTSTNNARNVLRQLKAINDRGDGQMIASMLVGYVKQGKMTYQEAAWVADQLNVKIN